MGGCEIAVSWKRIRAVYASTRNFGTDYGLAAKRVIGVRQISDGKRREPPPFPSAFETNFDLPGRAMLPSGPTKAVGDYS